MKGGDAVRASNRRRATDFTGFVSGSGVEVLRRVAQGEAPPTIRAKLYKGNSASNWVCRCSCGTVFTANVYAVRDGRRTACRTSCVYSKVPPRERTAPECLRVHDVGGPTKLTTRELAVLAKRLGTLPPGPVTELERALMADRVRTMTPIDAVMMKRRGLVSVVVTTLLETADRPLGVTELANSARENVSTVSRACVKLATAGKIRCVGRGKYAAPLPTKDTP
jgi:hypothetical protein